VDRLRAGVGVVDSGAHQSWFGALNEPTTNLVTDELRKYRCAVTYEQALSQARHSLHVALANTLNERVDRRVVPASSIVLVG
jgi:hypothetical protein